MNKRRVILSALALASTLLAGCSEMNEFIGNEDSVDYKSARRSEPLSIPPDLTQAANDPRYKATGTASYLEFQQQGEQKKSASTEARDGNVLPQRDDVRVERDGDLRWLVVNMPPDQLFPRIVDFWTENGFALDVNNPKAGLLETDWAENRTKINESWLRTKMGSLMDSIWDSGERERFRTRVERVNGHTEVFINHRQMVQRRVGNDGMQVQWQNGVEDPGLNAAMLARLMVYLGTDADSARNMVAKAEERQLRPVAESVRTGEALLVIEDPFDRAWRRVGVALDSGGFAVDDRDRSAGLYYVRYVDTDTGETREQPSFFSRMFSGDLAGQAAQYRIHVGANGAGQTNVTVLNADGVRDNSATAQRLLSVLKDKM